MLYLFSLNFHTGILLLLAFVCVLFYEAINGFHDTANAIATVIYTRAIQSHLAVIIASIFNFFGVLLGGERVAYAIVHILPTDLLFSSATSHDLAMVFSLLFSAIIWNLSTWYFGIPASSSHTLIGAVIGVGLTNSLLIGSSIIEALNFPQVFNILASLIISPIIGFVVAGGLVFILCRYWNNTKKRARIHLTPSERERKDGKKKPPFWTRIALILSAIGVAFSHGANDGQKGIGLMMLALISIAPANFVVNINASSYEITRTRDAINNVITYFQQHPMLLKREYEVEGVIPSSKISNDLTTSPYQPHQSNIVSDLEYVKEILINVESYDQLTTEQRSRMRNIILRISDVIDRTANLSEINDNDHCLLNKFKKDILNTIEYIPIWIIVAVALSLGVGTMIGWKRIAITIIEKIGKKDMTYAQGMSAQVTAALSIGIASYTGMPVSTTHVLSSSIAGTMIVNGSGLQRKTVTNILMVWIFTLPVSIILSSALYIMILRIL